MNKSMSSGSTLHKLTLSKKGCCRKCQNAKRSEHAQKPQLLTSRQVPTSLPLPFFLPPYLVEGRRKKYDVRKSSRSCVEPLFLQHSKKGQFYILTAIVLITYAFMITRPSAVVQEKRDVFKELYQNFISESPVVVNNALYDGANVSARFTGFAGSYADYAISRSPNFRFLYILKDGESMLVGNRLGMSVNVTVAGSSYNVTDRSTLTVSPADVSVDAAGIVHGFGVGPGAYQVKSLFRQKTGDGVRVYVNS